MALVLSPPPVHALITLDDRSRMRLTSSRHKLTVVSGRKTIVLRIRGDQPRLRST